MGISGKRSGSSLKELIREKLEDKEIFSYYINKATGQELRLGKAIRSPLRATDKHPSFNVYRNNKGQVRFKDFAGEEGDVFDFIRMMFNCDFKQACEIIASDFNLSQSSSISYLKAFKQVNITNLPVLEDKQRANVEWIISNTLPLRWTKIHMEISSSGAYWAQYGIDHLTLNLYDIHRIISCKIGEVHKVRNLRQPPIAGGKPRYLIFGYTYEDPEAKRLYFPDEKNKKYRHMGNANSNDIFGLKQLKEIVTTTNKKVPLVILAAGQKDCLSIHSHCNVMAICLNSESCALSAKQYIEIMSLTDKLAVCYDNDDTGRKYAAKLYQQYNIGTINIGVFTKQKDVSDYYKNEVIKLKTEDQLCKTIQKMLS